MMKRARMAFYGLGVVCVAAACSAPENDARGPRPAETEVVAEEPSQADLDIWLDQLEVGSRELYSARHEVVDAVGLEPGDWIADIGSGTGLHTLLFAEAVGESGEVFAEDIEPLFLDLVTRRAADADLGNVTAVLGREDDVTLPEGAFDVVFIADTYHYFGDREAVMRSVIDALKPGGELVLVEFRFDDDEERPDYKSHVRFGKEAVIAELEYVGFAFEGDVEVEGLDENFFIRMRKPLEE